MLFSQGNDKLHAFVDAQFFKNTLQVKLNGESADGKHFRNFIVVVTLRGQLHYFFFPAGEPGFLDFYVL